VDRNIRIVRELVQVFEPNRMVFGELGKKNKKGKMLPPQCLYKEKKKPPKILQHFYVFFCTVHCNVTV